MRTRNSFRRRTVLLLTTSMLVLMFAFWSFPCNARQLSTQTTMLVNNTNDDIRVYYRFPSDPRWHGPLTIRSQWAIRVVGSRPEYFVVSRTGARTYLGVVDVGAVQRIDRYAQLIIEPHVSRPR